MQRCHAAAVVGIMGRGASAAVPELTECLHDPEYLVCHEAALALARMGPDARPAVPDLTEVAQKHWHRKVRAAALKTLRQIDPEAAARAEGGH